MSKVSSIVLCAVTFFSVHASSAQAQVSRAVVSGSNNAVDANPCTYAAPCASLTVAIAALPASGGVVDVLGPGFYGPVILAKPITLLGHGWATISADSGGAAITVTASPVIISGVQLDGGGTGGSGIAFTSAGRLTVLDSVVTHFASDGISVSPPAAAASYLTLRNVVLTNNAANGVGVYAQTANVTVSGENVTASGNDTGVHVLGGPYGAFSTTFDHLVANGNWYGFHLEGAGNGNNYLRNSMLIFNSTGDVLQESSANGYISIHNHSDIGTIVVQNTANPTIRSDESNNISQIPSNMQTVGTR